MPERDGPSLKEIIDPVREPIAVAILAINTFLVLSALLIGFGSLASGGTIIQTIPASEFGSLTGFCMIVLPITAVVLAAAGARTGRFWGLIRVTAVVEYVICVIFEAVAILRIFDLITGVARNLAYLFRPQSIAVSITYLTIGVLTNYALLLLATIVTVRIASRRTPRVASMPVPPADPEPPDDIDVRPSTL